MSVVVKLYLDDSVQPSQNKRRNVLPSLSAPARARRGKEFSGDAVREKMLIKSHRPESLSRAYIQAIAGRCGMNCSLRDFDYGIDVTLHEITWIDAIARSLRSGNEPQQRKLRGRVIRLSAENPLSTENGSLVIVMDVESPNAPYHVEIILTSEQYRQACYAHLEGRPIVVYGTLAKMGRRWLLMDVTDFQAVQTESIR
jgi:hypothetical protein